MSVSEDSDNDNTDAEGGGAAEAKQGHAAGMAGARDMAVPLGHDGGVSSIFLTPADISAPIEFGNPESDARLRKLLMRYVDTCRGEVSGVLIDQNITAGWPVQVD